jgi:hypothetical protein
MRVMSATSAHTVSGAAFTSIDAEDCCGYGTTENLSGGAESGLLDGAPRNGHHSVVSQALTAVRLAYRRSRTLVALTVVALVAVSVMALNHHPSSRSVGASERQLRTGFVEPLTKSGLATEVLDTCHYWRSSTQQVIGPADAWHFSVKIAVSASPDAVARVLDQKTGAVITGDDSSFGIQQYRGDPQRGWNGGIAVADGGSVVALVKNNIATSERSVPIGWQPICPESRPS